MAQRNALILSSTLHLIMIGLIMLLASKPSAELPTIIRYKPVRLVSMPGEPGIKPIPKQKETEKTAPKPKAKPKPKVVEKSQPIRESKPVESSLDKTDSKAINDEKVKGEAGKSNIGTGSEDQGGIQLDGADFPYPYYLSNIQIKILSNFKPRISAKDVKGLKAVVYFIIDRGGRISEVKLENKSGHFLFDQEAQRAVLRSNPMPALPPAFGSDRLGVHFEFVASE